MSVKSEIEELCTKALNFDFISIENESHHHSSSQNAESHFKLILVSNHFLNMSLIKRHRYIYKFLNEIMPKIHALAIHAFTEEEFKDSKINTNSPDCVNKNG
jgi:BolA protein